MKKVVSIHLAGHIFQIEEDAYQKLENALCSVRLQNPQKCETLEAFFAEQFQSRLELGQKVITFQMVYEELRDKGLLNQQAEESHQNPYAYSSPKRIFRSLNEKVIAGVCGGLGEYWNIDPVLIRLALVVLFFGAGFGGLLYILMWILIPVDTMGR